MHAIRDAHAANERPCATVKGMHVHSVPRSRQSWQLPQCDTNEDGKPPAMGCDKAEATWHWTLPDPSMVLLVGVSSDCHSDCHSELADLLFGSNSAV